MIKDYTTQKSPEETIGEIQQRLNEYEISAMMTEYDGRQVSSVSFKIKVEGKDMSFKMPCNWRAVHQIFKDQGLTNVRHKDKSLDNQAIRTAWRLIYHWVDAQLAMVEVNMVTIPQVFLPYAMMPDGRTLSEHVGENPEKLLQLK